VQRAAWVGFAVVVPGVIVVSPLGNSLSTSVPLLVLLWWVFPFAVSTASFACLLGLSIVGRLGRRLNSGFPTSAYLASGPSLAGLNLFSFFSLGSPPPYWVGWAMISLLFLSSLVYYQIIKRSDEDKRSFAASERQFSSSRV